MARARVCALLLTFSVSFFGAHSADLKCLDITAILSGNRIIIHPWWDYGSDRTYRNRNCDKCHLNQDGADCKDNSCGHMSGPVGQSVDLLPADSEKWICPGFCASMPQIPIKMNLVKYVSTWECIGHWIAGGCTIHNTRVDTQPAVVNQLPMSTPLKPSYSDVLRISECKTKRYEDNFNARVTACRQWSSLSSMPQMAHLDVFWTDGAARAYTFDGVKEKTQTISQCRSIDNIQHYLFQSGPCWMGTVLPDQQKKQFSIKPYYIYYRGKESKSQVHDCRMRVLGVYNEQSNKWDDSALLPPDSAEWNINSHWSNPPTRSAHFYKFKTVFDVMQDTFGQFNQNEAKTIATWDFTIPCVDSDNKKQRSTKVYYAESGCTQQTCVDFITKPCYDNIYRFDKMVCTLIQAFAGGPMKFSQFKDKIMSSDQKEPFMSYGNSHFEISYDTAKVQVKKDTTITVIPNQPIIFTDDNTIFVSLIRDASNIYSCDACFDIPLFGRKFSTDTAMANDIIPCRACLGYEKVQVTASSRNYQDCKLCAKHQVRHPDPKKTDECRKCQEINALTPMRRAAPHPQTDAACKECQHFQYFNDESDAGCEFLQTVTDGILTVTNKKASLSGKDYYIKDKIRKEIDSKFWRDNINANTTWNTELVPQPCIPGFVEPATLVKRLKFTAWCGHQEMVRNQQAWLRLHGGMLYLPLNSDEALTHINTSVVELCGSNGSNALTRVQGSNAVDLTCGQHNFSIIRAGFQDPCTLCLGAKYTANCWPTYVRGLEQAYDDAYFLPSNYKDLRPQPGTCENCNARCDNNLQANSYIDPVEYSCWWNGTGRTPGLLGSTATTFAWYKQAPCTKCTTVKLTADLALLVLACGNRVSYRRWLSDAVTGSDVSTSISIPSTQICCAEALGASTASTATLCTDKPDEFETFAQLQCRQTVDDIPPAFIPYCPPFWYVDETCALASALWNPDCCVKCKSCRAGLFKLDTYVDCPGNQFFDSQDRGCTTKCLTNQYLRNERCIKCEACE